MITEIIKEEPVDVFIKKYINEEGTRVYTDVSFYGEHYYAAINEFLTKERIFFHHVKERVTAVHISKQDHVFKKATEKSRLNIEVHYTGLIRGNFKASKENCDCLWKIAQKYIIPKMLVTVN